MKKENKKGGTMFGGFKTRPTFSIIALSVFITAFVGLAIYVVYTSMASDGETRGPELTIAGEYAPDRILVRFKPGTRGEKQREVANRNGLEQIDEIPQIEAKVLKINDKGNVAAKIKALSKNPNIIYVEPDYIVKAELVPNDPIYPNQESYMRAISAPVGWDLSNGNKSVVIANLDTGVMSTHKDFTGRFVAGFNAFTKDSITEDDHGHGTVTTGVSSATGNNSLFVTGIDWGSRIMPVKVLSSNGSGTSSSLSQGLTWAADSGAHIANMSLGGTTASNTIENSMNYAYSKGMILVAASGNDGTGKVNYPAAYQSVIAVGALTVSSNQPNWDQKATFSSYSEQLELMAPGTRIYATTFDGKYAYASGTSVATPFVSGLARSEE
ncbi:S8 family serine peptidase, partial [Patescibacteria group bacterium]|nr:S8 family serine peptidase [Patescibacteria group bacterium]